MKTLSPQWSVFGDNSHIQKPFDAAVIMPTIGRAEIVRAVRSVYEQEGVERIQLLIGADKLDREIPGLIDLFSDSPAHVTPCYFNPGYSTSARHGGLHAARDGGALRSTLTYLANARHVAYLDDDNWWAPTHLHDLLHAINGRSWAFSLRWFIESESLQPLCIDEWESVGPGRGMFAQSQGGYVDPNCLMLDKIAALRCVAAWSFSLPGDRSGLLTDRNVFNCLLHHQGKPGETNNATALYVINPHDAMHPFRLKNFNEKKLKFPSFSSIPEIASRPLTADIQAQMRQALAYHKNGQNFQAEELFNDILKNCPDSADALHMLGVIAYQGEAYQHAADLIGKAIALNPKNAAYYSDRGLALQQLKQFEEALDHYDKALSLQPDLAITHLNRGNVLSALGQHEAAVGSYDVAVALLEKETGSADALHQLGLMAFNRKEYQRAVDLIGKAIALNTDNAAFHSDRGLALQRLKRLDEAMESYDKAIALNPGIPVIHLNRGNALKEKRLLDAAINSYNNAIAIKPDYATAHWNKSLEQLILGDFDEGWKSFEWRWKEDSFPSPRRNFPRPLWLGKESLQGRTILLHSEQGLGDTIQFCRFIPNVAELGARVILEVERPLLGLLNQLPGVSEFVAKGLPLPAFELQAPLLSLPLAFKTTLNTIPSTQQYLAADPRKVSQWQRKLGLKTKPRIGLVWSGRPEHQNDHMRSLQLSELVRHIPPGLEYVCLQKEIRPSDRETLESHNNIACYGEELNDFADTAALCELMDVIISVDTSVAHLSGALGRQTWLMLPFIPDWRWLLERDDSPWYQSLKLYRQTAEADWSSVLHRVKHDLSLIAV